MTSGTVIGRRSGPPIRSNPLIDIRAGQRRFGDPFPERPFCLWSFRSPPPRKVGFDGSGDTP
ncbi:MAG: hypothetical protein ACYCYP_08255 [Leptospirales bacterium]